MGDADAVRGSVHERQEAGQPTQTSREEWRVQIARALYRQHAHPTAQSWEHLPRDVRHEWEFIALQDAVAAADAVMALTEAWNLAHTDIAEARARYYAIVRPRA